MKSLIKKTVILSSVIALASCASYRQTAPLIGYDNNHIGINVNADLDLEHAKKINATNETKHFLGIPLVRNGHKTLKSSTFYKGLSERERQALYKAKTEANVDIILAPEFTAEKHCWLFGAFRKSSTTVTGWGVNVKGLKE